jgi:hypothetical protein
MTWVAAEGSGKAQGHLLTPGPHRNGRSLVLHGDGSGHRCKGADFVESCFGFGGNRADGSKHGQSSMRENAGERYGLAGADSVSLSRMVERFISAVLSPHEGHVLELLPTWLQFPQR